MKGMASSRRAGRSTVFLGSGFALMRRPGMTLIGRCGARGSSATRHPVTLAGVSASDAGTARLAGEPVSARRDLGREGGQFRVVLGTCGEGRIVPFRRLRS